MKKLEINEKQLKYMEFLNRENNFSHHSYNEEMKQYELLKVGDLEAIKESIKMFSSPTLGTLSANPLTNCKYLFIASTTLATRFAIEGGLNSNLAYNISDLFIHKMDNCNNIDEIKKIHTEMFTFFTSQVAKLTNKNIYSKPIMLCIDYIYNNLNENISLNNIANSLNLNSNYLSVLFKKEIGISFSEYVINKKIETAKNMLKYSDYSFAEISFALSFSSQSHFTKSFKKITGYTPKQYKDNFYDKFLK